MILDASIHATSILEEAALGTAVEDKIFWELAEQTTQIPFVVFTVADSGPGTKNGLTEIEVNVRVFGSSITASATIAKQLRNAIDSNNTRWRDRGARSGYTNTDAKEGYIEITYNFKL
ncbi:MAG TPA: hypothetical protein VFM70_02670 [Salinimicrobium sp.]|nr:hypothetical protein [Salinimicrobium sp.]